MAVKRLTSPYAPKAPPRPATPREGDAIAAVRELTATLGRAPNAVEVAAQLGIAKQNARKLLRRLEAKGLLRDVPKLVSSGQWAVTGDE